MRILVLLCALFVPFLALAELERVSNYHSDIEVSANGSMWVTERIDVVSTGDYIKRGIFRSIPTKYKDKNGLNYQVEFELLEVRHNGKPCSYHTERLSNGIKIYIGESGKFIDKGAHSYEIRYRTDRQMAFYEDHDVLYWNVTGNGWSFPIEKVSCKVRFPNGVQFQKEALYYGLMGSDKTGGTIERDLANNSLEYTFNQVLESKEGLTIVSQIDKGLITPPSVQEETARYISDNLLLALAALLFFLACLYYYWAWKKVGVDPPKGNIIPRFYPPADISPAGMRYLDKMRFDNTAFTAELVQLAMRGVIKINEVKNQYFVEQLIKNPSGLSIGEQKIISTLFAQKNTFHFKGKRYATIQAAISGLKGSLKSEFSERYFKHNAKYLVPGVVLSILSLLIYVFQHVNPAHFVMLPSAIFLAALIPHGVRFAQAIAQKQLYKALGFGIFLIPIIIILSHFGDFFLGANTIKSLVVLLAVIGVNGLFYYLIKAPTMMGREIMDGIDGYKLYLMNAEKHRIDFQVKHLSPAEYETHLPYAVALGVEKQWSKRFAGMFEELGENYQPTWYGGKKPRVFSPAVIASSLGSMSNTISAASVAPSSTSSGSGSFGGGFSGGGGGGGGGGGW